MKSSFLVLAVSLLCVAGFSLPVVAEERALLELYALAKAKDPVLGRAASKLEAVKADKDIAWAAVLPRVDAAANVRQLRHEVIDYEPTTMRGEYTGFGYSATGRVALFSMPAYFSIEAAGAGVRSAEAGMTVARQELIVRVVDACIKLLKTQADERYYRDELARMGRILQQTEAFFEAGTVDVIAVYEARSRQDSAAADLVKSEGQRRLAEQNLARITGIPVVSVKGISVAAPKVPEPAGIDWWIETMQKRHPAVVQAQEDLSRAESSRKAASSNHLPSMQASGGYTVDKGSTFLPDVETRQWYAGLNVTIPIYSGGETSARVRQSLADETERRIILEDTRDQGMQKLKEVFLSLHYSSKLAEAYKRKSESAEIQLKAVKKGHSIGSRTDIDLLNAEQALAVSHRDLAGALYDTVQLKLELKAAAGILTEADLAAFNTQ